MGKDGFGQIALNGFWTGNVWRSRYHKSKYKIQQPKDDCQWYQEQQEYSLEKDDDASESGSSWREIWFVIDSIGYGIHDDLLSNE